MLVQAHHKLLFIGDSITDCGRARPVGEGLGDAAGHGYVNRVDGLLNAAYPERKIRVVNMGVSGDTVRDLAARWEADVTAQRPDWVAVMIGANDVWRQFDSPRQTECHVLPDEYEATLDRLVGETAPRAAGTLLMTPYYIEPNRADAMRARMDEYGAAVKRIAARHGARLADVQAAFDRQLEHHYPTTFGWDRVHANPLGAMVIARAALEALEYRW